MKNRNQQTRMRSRPRPVASLRPDDLKAHPIWRFVEDDEADETYVWPVGGRRVTRLAGKVVGAEVTLADGSQRWGVFSNVDADNPELTEHFITLSLFVAGRWFHLARYHDIDARKRGPRALAAALRRPVGRVFPIRYDLRPFMRNAPPWLEGTIRRSPRQRLPRAPIIALAVPKL